MSIDDLLFTIIIGGVVLSISYLRAQYMMRRSYRIFERGSELRLRELYATRPNAHGGSLKGPARPVPSPAADEGHLRCHEGQKLYV
jgi:hypothetical protein